MHRAHGHLSWFVCVVRNPDSQRKQPRHPEIQTWMGRLLSHWVCRSGMPDRSKAFFNLGCFYFGVLGFAIAPVFFKKFLFCAAVYCATPSSSSWVVYEPFGCPVFSGISTGRSSSVWPGFHCTQKVTLQAWNNAMNQRFRFVGCFFSFPLKQLIL